MNGYDGFGILFVCDFLLFTVLACLTENGFSFRLERGKQG